MKVIDIKNLDKNILPTKKVEEFRSFDISKLFEKELKDFENSSINTNKFNFLENENFYNIYLKGSNIQIQEDLKAFINIKKEKTKTSKVNKLYLLNSYYLKEEITLNIEKELDKPINIINIFDEEDSFFVQNLNIIFKANAIVIETFNSNEASNSLLSINRFYETKKDINANIYKIQTLNNSNALFNYITNLEENSTLNMVNLEYKAQLALNIFDSKLKSKNSNLFIDCVIKNKSTQKSGNIAFIEHIDENTLSDIKVKHLLDEKAHSLFDISSTVQNSAKYAKAFQNSQTILLSDNARINANPRLQIFVDELEASHGASCGTLNEDELYYLCSRGISKQKAKKMIIDSTELQVIKKIKTKAIRRYIKDIRRIYHV